MGVLFPINQAYIAVRDTSKCFATSITEISLLIHNLPSITPTKSWLALATALANFREYPVILFLLGRASGRLFHYLSIQTPCYYYAQSSRTALISLGVSASVFLTRLVGSGVTSSDIAGSALTIGLATAS